MSIGGGSAAALSQASALTQIGDVGFHLGLQFRHFPLCRKGRQSRGHEAAEFIEQRREAVDLADIFPHMRDVGFKAGDARFETGCLRYPPVCAING
ncbi:MAG: hypothetical protein JO081_04000 [Alphaproteobacteria bacterium]|nr:hypothetical protein [Alphaproteobacteria bacterium]